MKPGEWYYLARRTVVEVKVVEKIVQYSTRPTSTYLLAWYFWLPVELRLIEEEVRTILVIHPNRSRVGLNVLLPRHQAVEIAPKGLAVSCQFGVPSVPPHVINEVSHHIRLRTGPEPNIAGMMPHGVEEAEFRAHVTLHVSFELVECLGLHVHASYFG
jgi:hypothetical protein